MKFQLDEAEGVNAITRVAPGQVWVQDQLHEQSVLVPWRGSVQAWAPQRFEELEPMHFEAILALQPELVILSSGAKLRFTHPSLYRSLIEARVGIETMDLNAASRTYTVLAGEGRKVVAALLLA